MPQIRPFQPGDLDDLYRICLATGADGGDAGALYDDPRLLGDVYAAPYAILAPDCAFVAVDEAGVGGYILGAADTRAFETLAEARWWPGLRDAHADPTGTPHRQWTADQRLAWLIHHPPAAPDDLVAAWPSHLHIDLLPRLQGRGAGRRMIDHWLGRMNELGSPGVHLGVGEANRRARRFYAARGFTAPRLAAPPPRGVVWLAIGLGA
ncbi:MAG TPA: GNAT family N-acetyltransferase [Caulobacteraceae bacterium]|nr:GNAT family N-acetyltransferase [Caulobacteraceae bacterium]